VCSRPFSACVLPRDSPRQSYGRRHQQGHGAPASRGRGQQDREPRGGVLLAMLRLAFERSRDDLIHELDGQLILDYGACPFGNQPSPGHNDVQGSPDWDDWSECFLPPWQLSREGWLRRPPSSAGSPRTHREQLGRARTLDGERCAGQDGAISAWGAPRDERPAAPLR
jgi:hypothetical protein